MHALNFNPQVSHYNREHTPNRRYLDSHLSVTALWNDYNKSHQFVSYSVYFEVFKSLNIGFKKPSQDECTTCAQIKAHRKETSCVEDCNDCEMAKIHLEKAKKARENYQKDHEYPQDSAVFAADMQRVILLPKLPSKEHFFVSRLVVFNETFAALSDSPDYCMLWHEAISGR